MRPPVILTVASSDYAARWWFCLASQRAYAERLGLEYRLETGTVPPLNHKWSKIRHVYDLLRSGRDVLLIDADAEIAPAAPSFLGKLAERPDADYAGHAISILDRLKSDMGG